MEIFISHELGHFYSFKKSIYNDELNSAYKNINRCGKASKKQKDLIIKEERLAWKNAKILLKKIKFNNWNYFNKVKNINLNSYKEMEC